MEFLKDKILIVIIIVSLMFGAGALHSGHEWGDDWAWYVLQSKSIWDGTTDQFIEISDFTNYQSTSHLGPLAYPWGFPLFLAPFYALNGISPLTLKIPGLLFYAGFLLVLYVFSTSRFTRTQSLLLVALFAFNPLLLFFTDYILSDIPFLFFSTLTLCLVTRDEPRSRWYYAFIGASIFGTAFMRATGILLLGCYLAVEFFRMVAQRRDREAAKRIIINTFIVCATFAALWILNAVVFPSGGESYLTQYENLTIGLVRNFTGLYFNVFSSFFGAETGWRYLYYFVLLFALLGAWIRRKEESFFLWFFVLWMLVHITYPYWQGPRYIFPLLPILIYFAFQGMRFVIGKLPAKNQLAGQWAFFGFWFLIFGYFLVYSASTVYVNLRDDRQINGPFDPVSMEVYDYIKRKAPRDSVLIFYKARVMRLMTGYPSIMINECDGMLRGDYLILSKKEERNNQVPVSEIASCNLPLDKELENRRFIIYKIVK